MEEAATDYLKSGNYYKLSKSYLMPKLALFLLIVVYISIYLFLNSEFHGVRVKDRRHFPWSTASLSVLFPSKFSLFLLKVRYLLRSASMRNI